ncbi:hypothetical protein [Aestuariirhabdus sp. LZHN29]|uniref:hypothetical protein n=1 Tax=Aestuariirhabdus sp. LZHN29 TaxID=3417462 RepID=UPI003CEB57F5
MPFPCIVPGIFVYGVREGKTSLAAIDNLEEVAFEGKVIVHLPHDPDWGEGSGLTSAVLTDPTWLDLCVVANDFIDIADDRLGTDLKDTVITGVTDGITYVAMVFSRVIHVKPRRYLGITA